MRSRVLLRCLLMALQSLLALILVLNAVFCPFFCEAATVADDRSCAGEACGSNSAPTDTPDDPCRSDDGSCFCDGLALFESSRPEALAYDAPAISILTALPAHEPRLAADARLLSDGDTPSITGVRLRQRLQSFLL